MPNAQRNTGMTYFFGKLFASCFTGSMYGAGPVVFAVWAYVFANARGSSLELNPALLADVIGSDRESIKSAIEYLCSPDPYSQNPEEEGRRLVHEGAFQYRVVSLDRYRSIHKEEERREYNRLKKREERAKNADRQQLSAGVSNRKHSTSTDADLSYSFSSSKREGWRETQIPTSRLPIWSPARCLQSAVFQAAN